MKFSKLKQTVSIAKKFHLKQWTHSIKYHVRISQEDLDKKTMYKMCGKGGRGLTYM